MPALSSFFTRQRIPASQMRVLNLRRELPVVFGYSLFFILLSGCTALVIKHWPIPLFGAEDYLLDFWYVVFFKIAFLLVLPLFVYWRIGYSLRDAAPGGLSKRDYIWSFVAVLAGLGINA